MTKATKAFRLLSPELICLNFANAYSSIKFVFSFL